MNLACVQKTIDQIVESIENNSSNDVSLNFYENAILSITSLLNKSLEEKIASYFYLRIINKTINNAQENLQNLEELFSYVNNYNSKCNKIGLKIKSKQHNINKMIDYRKRKLRLNKIRLKKYHSNNVYDKEYENNLISNIAILEDKIFIYKQKSDYLEKKYYLLEYKSQILNVYDLFVKNLINILKEYKSTIDIINCAYKNIDNINRLSSDLSSKFWDFKKLYDLFVTLVNKPIENEININAIKWFQKVLNN